MSNIDKVLDFVLAKAVSSSIWKGLSALASLPLNHLLVFGVVVVLCILLIKVATPFVKLLLSRD